MTKFLSPPSPTSRTFSVAHRIIRDAAPAPKPRAIVEAPLDERQAAALASYERPAFAQGGVPCVRAKAR